MNVFDKDKMKRKQDAKELKAKVALKSMLSQTGSVWDQVDTQGLYRNVMLTPHYLYRNTSGFGAAPQAVCGNET